jgi:hypothetical protein
LEEEGTAVGTLLCNPTAILDKRRRPSTIDIKAQNHWSKLGRS